MTKIWFPLYARIVVCLIANLVLVLMAVLFWIPGHFGVGWSPLLTDAVRDRLQHVGEQIASEIRPAMNQSWKVDLSRFNDSYRVDFAIYDGEGRLLAGDDHTVPAAVLRELQKTRALMSGVVVGSTDPKSIGQKADDRSLTIPNWPYPDRNVLKRWIFVVEAETVPQFSIGIRTPISAADGKLIPATIVASTSNRWHAIRFIDIREWFEACLLLIGASILLWSPILWTLSRSLHRIIGATKRIAVGQFDTRIETSRADELGELAAMVNTVAERLDSFVESQKHFLANITHEVASPLGRLQLGLEVLKRDLSGPSLEAHNDIYEEVQLMVELINDLLAFSRVGIGDPAPRLETLALTKLIQAVLKRENASGKVITSISRDLFVLGNSSLLVRALGNLVRNGVRYAADSLIPMEITAEVQGKSIEVRVMDRGPGVPELSLIKLGDPFYRPETARQRETGGIGLGLATVKNCISACGGSVRFKNREGGGFEVKIILQKGIESG